MKTRGRPRKPHAERKDRAVAVRLDAERYRVVADAGKASGRTVSQELRWRILRSIEEDSTIRDRLGGEANYAFLRALAGLMATFSDERGAATWMHDPAMGQRFRYAALAMMDRMLPPTPPEVIADAAWAELEAIDRASQLLIDIVNRPGLPFDRIREGLGPILERQIKTWRAVYTDGNNETEIPLGGDR